MHRAIITGTSGFIGYALLQELLQHNYEVLAVVRTEDGARKVKRLQDPRVHPVICEIPDFTPLFQMASGEYDVFFHMAWDGVSGEKSRNDVVQRKNIQGAIQAVRAARALHCKRFVGAGSLHEIECIKEMEQQGKSLNLGNYYKTSKLAAHYYCKLEAARQDIDFLWPRLTNTYGAGEKSARLVNSMIRKLLAGESPDVTEATQLYNFIYITDAAKAYRLIAEKGTSYANYVLGSEEVRPLKEYLTQIRDVVNPDIEIGFGRHPYSGVYLEKDDLYTQVFFSDTGFKTSVPFQKGIHLTMEFLQSTPDKEFIV